MTVHHLIDALPAAFFGLLGIWAAVVRRHWFLRFSVVCVFLLVALLIPAYEVVIEFGIAISLIMAGVWLARGRRHESVRFSLESALLAMVVVAIGSAVIAKAPELGWQDWVNLFTIGGAVAMISLLSLWLVFGRASLTRRLPVSLLGFLVFTALYYFSSATHHLLLQPEWSYAWAERLWERANDPAILSWGLGHCIPTSLLGFSTLCSVLLLARGSRWFTDSNTEQSKQSGPMVAAARLGLVAFMLCLFSPLCYLFYRLMTPAQMPVIERLAPSGYDDFIAAGKVIEESVEQLRASCFGKLSKHELKKKKNRLADALNQIHVGLNQSDFWVPRREVNTDQAQADSAAFDKAAIALLFEYRYHQTFGTTEERIGWSLKTLRLGNSPSDAWEIMWPEQLVENEIRNLLGKLDSSDCQYLIRELEGHESRRQTLDRYLLQRRSERENRGWNSHLRVMLSEWSGHNPYDQYHTTYKWQLFNMRMLITQLALQSYFLDNNQLPDNLAELVPDYLPAIPIDPHTKKPLHYQYLWGGYALSTLGENAEDRALVTGPAAPYLWQRLQESWQSLQKAIAALPRNARGS